MEREVEQRLRSDARRGQARLVRSQGVSAGESCWKVGFADFSAVGVVTEVYHDNFVVVELWGLREVFSASQTSFFLFISLTNSISPQALH